MIDLIKINKFYNSGENQLHVLKNVSLDINSGDFVAIMGESGSGKSTLINILGFLDKNFTGIYRFENVEISKFSDNKLSDLRNKSVGFIFQQFQLIQTYTIAENVELPLLYQGKSYKYAREKRWKLWIWWELKIKPTKSQNNFQEDSNKGLQLLVLSFTIQNLL